MESKDRAGLRETSEADREHSLGWDQQWARNKIRPVLESFDMEGFVFRKISAGARVLLLAPARSRSVAACVSVL